MITWIGLCAGEIWGHLDAHEGKASLKEIFSKIEAPRETILMATGWLAREGHILIHGEHPDLLISLNTRPPSKAG